MKALLKNSLYRRIKATNKVEASGYNEAGSVIEVKSVVTGDAIDGIGIWFASDDGFFYWGGGCEFTGDEIFGNWNELSTEIQKIFLDSIVADQLFWFEKKTIDYLGCGWGYKNDNANEGLAVTVFVKQKIANPVLEKTVRYKGYNIPIDIKISAPFSHQEYINYTTPPPAVGLNGQMGGSIAIGGSKKYGTSSMILINKQGIKCLMTCFHVLLGNFKKVGNFPIEPPVNQIVELPCNAHNPFSFPLQSELKVLAGKYSAHYDFAVVEVPKEIQFRNAINNVDFSGYYLLEELKNLIHKRVTVVGATSYLQTGIVKDVRSSLPVNNGHVCHNITEMISKGGDSGAPVIDSNGKLVGIVVSGNGRDRTLVLPITFLFTQLGYTLFK
jgi:hypothetical protein